MRTINKQKLSENEKDFFKNSNHDHKINVVNSILNELVDSFDNIHHYLQIQNAIRKVIKNESIGNLINLFVQFATNNEFRCEFRMTLSSFLRKNQTLFA